MPAGEREELLRTVAALPADVSVLLIEHDMDIVFGFANRMTVLVNGAVYGGDTPGDFQPTPGSRPCTWASRSMPMPDLLKMENLSAGYGEAMILERISLSLAAGETLALLGDRHWA